MFSEKPDSRVCRRPATPPAQLLVPAQEGVPGPSLLRRRRATERRGQVRLCLNTTGFSYISIACVFLAPCADAVWRRPAWPSLPATPGARDRAALFMQRTCICRTTTYARPRRPRCGAVVPVAWALQLWSLFPGGDTKQDLRITTCEI